MGLKTLILLLLTSCAGYQVKTMVNPFKYHGIHSISIPTFINKSVFPQVAATFTKDITMVLEGHEGLSVIGSEAYDKSDAILIGVIDSPSNLRNAKKASSSYFITAELEKSIWKRQPFYISKSTTLNLSVRLILIRKPSKEEIKLLTSAHPAKFSSPQVVFEEVFNLSHGVERFYAGQETTDKAGAVILSKNEGLVQKALKTMSKQSSVLFKELIINAF